MVSKLGVRIDPAKVEKIRDVPTPKNGKEVLAFIGVANYFRKNVRNFSLLASILALF